MLTARGTQNADTHTYAAATKQVSFGSPPQGGILGQLGNGRWVAIKDPFTPVRRIGMDLHDAETTLERQDAAIGRQQPFQCRSQQPAFAPQRRIRPLSPVPHRELMPGRQRRIHSCGAEIGIRGNMHTLPGYKLVSPCPSWSRIRARQDGKS